MKRTFVFLSLFFALSVVVDAQRSIRSPKSVRAVVIDPRLAVVRDEPGYFGKTLRRLRRGREVTIIASKQADGVSFVRVSITKRTSGWIQRDALATRSAEDEARLLRNLLTLDGFDQLESARIFLGMFPNSTQRARVLLVFAEVSEAAARKLTEQANKRLKSVTDQPVYYGYLLNYSGLDRYRRLGVNFVVNAATRKLHYSGDAWAEIVRRFPNTAEAEVARKRMAELDEKMKATN